LNYLLSLALALPLLAGAAAVHAQETSKLDAGVTFIAQRSLKANSGQNFWTEGGSIELGANIWKGWGVAANIAATHGNSIGTSGVPLSLETATFGPRYRWHPKQKWSIYGQTLLGEANAFHTLVPAASGAQTDGNGLALQIGGGVDLKLRQRFALRLLDAAWLHTQLPNATNNVQNTLRLGAGVVVRFGH